MFENKVFKFTLLISLLVHGAILSRTANFPIFPSSKKENKEVEVAYLKPPEEKQMSAKIDKAKAEPFLKIPSKISMGKKLPPPFVSKEDIFKKSKGHLEQISAFSKPTVARPDLISVKKKITLPPIDRTKIKNPSYISYYQIVREKIKRSAYQNYTGKEEGEVTVSFVISKDGKLQDMRITDDKSSPSTYLREITIESINDASSFPEFPQELDYPELSFTIAISFETE